MTCQLTIFGVESDLLGTFFDLLGTFIPKVAVAEVELGRVGNQTDIVREREALVAREINLAAVGLELADSEREFACAR